MTIFHTIFDFLPVLIQKLVKSMYYKCLNYRNIIIHTTPVRVQKTRQQFKPIIPSPRVVYMTGMPRTGTSLAKNFLASYTGLNVIKYHEKGYQHPWEVANQVREIIIDKGTTKYMYGAYRKIYLSYGNQIGFYCLVRDPRDELTSLCEKGIHTEIYRDFRFWQQWANMYNAYLKFTSYIANPLRWYLIRYEDLVRWPIQAKIDFLKWLGIEVNINTITAEYGVIHNDDQQDWKLKEHRTVKPHSIGRWIKVTDPKTKLLLTQWRHSEDAKVLMQRLGYTENGVNDCSLDFLGLTVFQPQVIQLKSV